MPIPLTDKQILELTPRIFGTIRWRSSVGEPRGDFCSGFDILVQEHTATQYEDIGGGKIVPIPGTGIWKEVRDSVSCRTLTTQDNTRAVNFYVTGLHLNAFPDGYYRITPTFRGTWYLPSLLSTFGYRAIEPISWNVKLTEGAHIQNVEFEVIRRSWFSGRRLA